MESGAFRGEGRAVEVYISKSHLCQDEKSSRNISAKFLDSSRKACYESTPNYYIYLFNIIMVHIILAVGLNILVGSTLHGLPGAVYRI